MSEGQDRIDALGTPGWAGLADYMESLRNKEISIIFSGGEDITGELIDVLPDALIISAGKKIAICSVEKIVVICEGKWNEEATNEAIDNQYTRP